MSMSTPLSEEGMRLAICVSHPIQYYSPLFCELAKRLQLKVFYAHRPSQADQSKAGFGVKFEWDRDLLSGYELVFLKNEAREPGLHHFGGCCTPEIGRQLWEGRFDAVLVMGWHLKSYVQSILAAKHQGLPVMVRGDSQLGTPRSVLKRAVKRLGYPPLLRLFDAALYVGERSRQYYEHYWYPSGRLFHSPHCVDNDWFAQRATNEARMALRSKLGIGVDSRVVLLAGKLVPCKRPLDAVDACVRLRTQGEDIQLLVAGAGELEGAIRAGAAKGNLPVHLLGFCNQTEMPAAYAAADLLVLPSSSETWGLVANEALASGRPVVVSDACGCAPDLAVDGTAGRVFPTGQVIALARAISATLRDPPDYRSINEKATAHSVRRACDGIVEALSALFSEAAVRKAVSRSGTCTRLNKE